ncbi:MAG: preprotein translocase subunit YajC [Chloroflexota bacterium]
MNLFSLAVAAPLFAQAPGGGSMVSTLIMFGLIIFVMYFMMIRPQQKRQKEHKSMLASIKNGDRVITTSGMHGSVVATDDTTFTVQIADNVRVKFEKSAIVAKESKE